MFELRVAPLVYIELDKIFLQIKILPTVRIVRYENKVEYLDWEAVEQACSMQSSILLKYFILSTSKEKYTLIAHLRWSDEALSLYSCFPMTTNVLEFESFQVLSMYSVSLINESNVNLLLIDSARHHPEITTHPHHRHEKLPRFGETKRVDPGPFETRYDSMMRLLSGYIV